MSQAAQKIENQGVSIMSYPTLKFDHPDEIQMLREEVFKFAQSELAPRAAEIDEKNEFPMDMWKKLGDLGLLGITAPAEYGGAEMGVSGACNRDGRAIPCFGICRA